MTNRRYSVMAVCAGNICRSPIAEAVLAAAFEQAGLDVEVTSAGTGGWHVGDDAHPQSRAVLERHGYSLRHSARQFEAAWLDHTDLVLALDLDNLSSLRRLAARHGLDHAHVRLLRSFDSALSHLPSNSPELGVPDPYNLPYREYEVVLAMVESAAPGVVDFVRLDLANRENY